MTTYSLYCDKMPALSQKVKVSSLNLFLDRGNIRETFWSQDFKASAAYTEIDMRK